MSVRLSWSFLFPTDQHVQQRCRNEKLYFKLSVEVKLKLGFRSGFTGQSDACLARNLVVFQESAASQ